MTDLELLEAAAQAAGVPIVPCTCSNPRWPYKHDEPKSGKYGHWNPLESDGDALRLAVKLELEIWMGCGGVNVGGMSMDIEEDYGNDPCASTRRAIVRAAAQLATKETS